MSNREGIEIDYCPTCRGVWLDRGELDKIIERSAAEQVTQRGEVYREPERGRDYDDDDRYREQGAITSDAARAACSAICLISTRTEWCSVEGTWVIPA
jgi:Zn-finger nucleic acid-binding protein